MSANVRDNQLRLATVLLPFIFAVHNAEEVLGLERWSQAVPSYVHSPVTTGQFGIAVALFTALGFLTVFFRRLYLSETAYFRVLAAFAGMLLLNVFFPHLIATLYFKAYAPGVISAVTLNLPVTAFILWRGVSLKLLRPRSAAAFSILGGVAGALLAALFLRIGAILTSP